MPGSFRPLMVQQSCPEPTEPPGNMRQPRLTDEGWGGSQAFEQVINKDTGEGPRSAGLFVLIAFSSVAVPNLPRDNGRFLFGADLWPALVCRRCSVFKWKLNSLRLGLTEKHSEKHSEKPDTQEQTNNTRTGIHSKITLQPFKVKLQIVPAPDSAPVQLYTYQKLQQSYHIRAGGNSSRLRLQRAPLQREQWQAEPWSRLRDSSSRLSWRDFSSMSQSPSAQPSDYFSQDVFNQLFDMLDQSAAHSVQPIFRERAADGSAGNTIQISMDCITMHQPEETLAECCCPASVEQKKKKQIKIAFKELSNVTLHFPPGGLCSLELVINGPTLPSSTTVRRGALIGTPKTLGSIRAMAVCQSPSPDR
ncbi:hypothetical protein NQZ68_017150 [Dissostichus eleginoides]|nr:hypothetical protein NQZ68_017150 [Dissostichus eleginoides]